MYQLVHAQHQFYQFILATCFVFNCEMLQKKLYTTYCCHIRNALQNL